jgi:hypothetical protein
MLIQTRGLDSLIYVGRVLVPNYPPAMSKHVSPTTGGATEVAPSSAGGGGVMTYTSTTGDDEPPLLLKSEGAPAGTCHCAAT